MNHIHGSVEASGQGLGHLSKLVESLASDAAALPEKERAGLEDFQKEFVNILEVIKQHHRQSQNAIRRTSEVVNSLRALSGIDGISYESTTLENIIDAAVSRLTLSTNWKTQPTDPARLCFADSCSEAAHTPVIGNTSLYAMALEWAVDSTLSELGSQGGLKVGFSAAKEHGPHHCLIIETTGTAGNLPRLTHMEKARIAHILKPYKCEIEEHPTAWHLSLCSALNEEIVAQAKAVRTE